mmetsp:Transcript_26913/g.30598  ORF Transcript_26913/g.30598 Transcript_26913/m.30598 type:complete len:95 (-) Transcript_26913:62-346(-)
MEHIKFLINAWWRRYRHPRQYDDEDDDQILLFPNDDDDDDDVIDDDDDRCDRIFPVPILGVNNTPRSGLFLLMICHHDKSDPTRRMHVLNKKVQ